MSRNDEIGNLDFQDIFLAFNCHIWYKIYSTSESESSVQASSSRAGPKIASFRFWGPAWPSSPWFQFIITVKDRKEVKLSVVVVVCYCLLLSVVVCCCLLLSVVVSCCLLFSVACCCCCCCCCCLLLLSVVCQVVCLTSIPPNFSANFESDGLEKTTSGNVLHHHFPILLEDNLVHSRRSIKLALEP